MPLPAGDLLSGFMKGAAEGLRVLAGREAKTVTNGGKVATEVITDEEEAEQRAIQAATAKESK